MDFNGAKDYIIHRLKDELNPSLYYHSVYHTLDVYEAAGRLSKAENIEGKSRALIETAALYHDSGMLIQYEDHEHASCSLVRAVLPGYGYTGADIEEIESMILITTMPQLPTYLHDQILCDADLDYLGRTDYFIHSFKLRLEWQVNGIRETSLHDWFQSQIRFLSEHRYFTNSANNIRNEQKQRNLEEIRNMLVRS